MNALIGMLRRRAATLWLWQGLFIVACAAIPVTNFLTVQEMNRKLKFAAMDSRDTFYLANLGNFESAQRVHAEIAKMAAETIFSRNPEGYDNAERLERLFNPAMTTALNKDAARDADTFRSQQIHQKIETGQIKEIEVDSNTALVSVEGQILRTGVFNSRVVNDTKRVTVFLKLKTNDDMAANGRYPLVVINYEEKFE